MIRKSSQLVLKLCKMKMRYLKSHKSGSIQFTAKVDQFNSSWYYYKKCIGTICSQIDERRQKTKYCHDNMIMTLVATSMDTNKANRI